MEKIINVYDSGDLRNKINELVDGIEDAKWKGGTVSQDILPSDPSSISLGAENNKFKALYADEVHISQNTLYIGDTPILGTDQDTINIKGDPDQSILMKTTGIGSTQLSSENGILLNTSGTTANININADGTNSEITMNAKTRVSFSAPEIKFEGSTTISDLTVTGTTTTVNSTNLAVKDNLIELNSGETGTGVSLGTAGIKVNRGDALPYLIQFDETDDMFKVGEQGNLETIASQEYVTSRLSEVSTYTHPESHPASMITGLATVATSGSYTDLSDKPTIPTSLPANGGNAATVNGHTVESNVPANAKFTDTTYTLDSFGITATASTQAAITPTSSKSGSTVTLKIPKVVTGIAAGDYTLQDIIQQLINKAHTHSTTSVIFTDEVTSGNCTTTNSCTSNNDCH